jgi:uncharacterized protein YndB with AHSA1/START domain
MAEQNRTGTNEAEVDSAPIVIERTFEASAKRVWEALTDTHQMKLWYFDVAEFKPEAGCEFQFEGGTENRKYVHKCRVLEAAPFRKLKHSWRYEGYEGNSFVTFELFEDGNKTRVRLTHEGLASFQKTNPDFARRNFVEGWTAIIGSSLKDYLGRSQQV